MNFEAGIPEIGSYLQKGIIGKVMSKFEKSNGGRISELKWDRKCDKAGRLHGMIKAQQFPLPNSRKKERIPLKL